MATASVKPAGLGLPSFSRVERGAQGMGYRPALLVLGVCALVLSSCSAGAKASTSPTKSSSPCDPACSENSECILDQNEHATCASVCESDADCSTCCVTVTGQSQTVCAPESDGYCPVSTTPIQQGLTCTVEAARDCPEADSLSCGVACCDSAHPVYCVTDSTCYASVGDAGDCQACVTCGPQLPQPAPVTCAAAPSSSDCPGNLSCGGYCCPYGEPFYNPETRQCYDTAEEAYSPTKPCVECSP